MTKYSLSWDKNKIQELLDRNNKAVERALIVIFNRQTKSEQIAENTQHHNNVGFTSYHARLGSYYAKWINSGRNLSGNHLEKARKIAKRYWRQLLDEIEQNQQKHIALVYKQIIKDGMKDGN